MSVESAEKGYVSDQTPGSIEEKALNPDTFPVEAFESTGPKVATPILTLKDEWDFDIGKNLTVVGTLNVTGASTLTGNTTVVGTLHSDSAISGDSTILGTNTFVPQFGQFHSITKQDLTTGWTQVANLVASAQAPPVGVGVSGGNTITFSKTGSYWLDFLGQYTDPSAVTSGAMIALLNGTEIEGSWTKNSLAGTNNVKPLPNSCLVKITDVDDVVTFSATASANTGDLGTYNGNESDPTTRTVFNCTTEKIANI